MTDVDGEFDTEAYIKRIRMIRKLCGHMSQTDFARYIDVAYKKWNHYERGYPIPRETAFKLYRKVPGISTDWIWFGDTSGLTVARLQQIEALEREETKANKAHVREPTRVMRKRISKTDKRRSL